MALNLSNDQLETLITRLVGAQQAGAAGGQASAVGPMMPCNLGIDKIKRLRQFNDWMKEVESKMEFMGVTQDKQKRSLLRSWAGRELLNFWEKEVRIKFTATEEIPARDGAAAIPAVAEDSYDTIITKTRTEILKHVNRDRSIIDLLNMKQGDETWMQFISELETAADLCRLDTEPFTREDAVRVAALAGMRDRLLAEKALAEKYKLETLVSVGATRETSKDTAQAIQGPGGQVSRFQGLALKRVPEMGHEVAPGILLEGDSVTEEDIDTAISNLTVMKLKKAGKYSVRRKDQFTRPAGAATKSYSDCSNCKSKHEQGRCPASGKTCFDCDQANHFAGSKACAKRKCFFADFIRY